MTKRPPKSPDAWTDARQRRGLAGELAARRALERDGWRIESHRFRAGRNEIDLVARLGPLVAFVEVKARRSDAYGPGREAVGWKKRQAIARVAEVWRLRHGHPGDSYRFDVVEVEFRAGQVPVLRRIEDAWRL